MGARGRNGRWGYWKRRVELVGKGKGRAGQVGGRGKGREMGIEGRKGRWVCGVGGRADRGGEEGRVGAGDKRRGIEEVGGRTCSSLFLLRRRVSMFWGSLERMCEMLMFCEG